jgi:hypothetical protein
MSRRVALVRTDVSEEPSSSIKVGIGELGTLSVTSNRRTRVGILHGDRRETSSLTFLIHCFQLQVKKLKRHRLRSTPQKHYISASGIHFS